VSRPDANDKVTNKRTEHNATAGYTNQFELVCELSAPSDMTRLHVIGM